MIGRRALVWVSLLSLGLGLGLAAALYLAWEVWPGELALSAPQDLAPAQREGYLILIAEAFDHDGDLDLARERLAHLARPGEHAADLVVALTQAYLKAGQDQRTLRQLVRLSHALGASTTEMLVHLPAEPPTPTRTPTPPPTAAAEMTATAQAAWATSTPTPTPSLTYQLVERRRECRPEEAPGQIQVIVRREDGKGLPGIRLRVDWAEGGGAIFTGFQPERGEGFADAVMEHPGDYRVVVLQDGGGDVVSDLYSDALTAGCPAGSRSVTWQVVFQQRGPTPTGG
ncbi:MAG: hypothetical protein GX605_09455 [Chloroflexi bacterium]|nr:hypothetical protein [Chloroflexota bacterium]